MKLKLELFRYGTLVFGRVLEQAEELRSQEKTVINKKGDFEIVSCSCAPALCQRALYVRGSSYEYDNIIFYVEYYNDNRAAEVCETIKELVAEINSDTDADLGGIVRVM